MKMNFKSYAIIWSIGLSIFNLCSFLIPSEAKFTASFWSGYGYITLAFILHLGTAFFTFKEQNKEKVFLNIPVFAISFITLVVTIIVGSFTMAVDFVPLWLGSVFCFSYFGISIGTTLLAKTAGDAVYDMDKKVKSQTSFIKNLTIKADVLVSEVDIPEIKAEATKVYEAIRYSDPISREDIYDIDEKILNQFKAFSEAVKANDYELVSALSIVLLNLLKSRNNKCKLLK